MSSTDDIFPNLLDHFQGEANKLAFAISVTQIQAHNPVMGSQREDNLLEFLNRYIPTRCKINKGGFVFDLLGEKSKQIDLLITSDKTLQFNTSTQDLSQSFNCIEGCICAISVKTTLDRNGLIDSIENLSSIPTHKEFLRHPSVANWDELLPQLPQKVIFAYRGESPETIVRNLEEYVNSTEMLYENIPDLIIVNNSCYIGKPPPAGTTMVGTSQVIPPSTFTVLTSEQSEHIGGRALFDLLVRVQKIANIIGFTDIDFDRYNVELGLHDVPPTR